MKSLIKSAVIIGQVLSLFMGDESTTPRVPERYPHVTHWFFLKG